MIIIDSTCFAQGLKFNFVFRQLLGYLFKVYFCANLFSGYLFDKYEHDHD